MKCWKTIPMPCAMASAGVENDTSVPLTRIQGRLAGAGLPHQGVDGGPADGDVDVVVGDHAREPLADPVELDGLRGPCWCRWLDDRSHGPS
jgi:hypothetical protein